MKRFILALALAIAPSCGEEKESHKASDGNDAVPSGPMVHLESVMLAHIYSSASFLLESAKAARFVSSLNPNQNMAEGCLSIGLVEGHAGALLHLFENEILGEWDLSGRESESQTIIAKLKNYDYQHSVAHAQNSVFESGTCQVVGNKNLTERIKEIEEGAETLMELMRSMNLNMGQQK